MKYTFNFPDLGEGLEEGTILEWYVNEGDRVNVGDSIVQMETDKVVADIPSPKKGTILLCHGNVGDVIHVGTPLVEIEVEDADTASVGKADKTITLPVSESEEGAAVVARWSWPVRRVCWQRAMKVQLQQGTSKVNHVRCWQHLLPVHWLKRWGLISKQFRGVILRAE